MNKLPLISIIVPAFNAGEYVERCLLSVRKQTYKVWELIFIDDGSTDDTMEKANKLANIDTRIRVIHTENKGVCSARNHGLEWAQGKYISFLDVDDELEEMALEKMYRSICNNYCDIYIGQCKRIKSDGKYIESRYSKHFEVWSGLEGVIKSLEDHPATYSVWGKLYKRSIIGATRFYVGRKVHEDSFFLFELMLKAPKVVVENEYIYRYHITPGSASRSVFSDKYLDILFFMEKKSEIIKEKYPQLESHIPNLVVKANMALLLNLCNTTNLKYRKLEKHCCYEVQRNQKKFRAVSEHNKKWFWIITHHLYQIYKIVYTLRKKNEKDR